MKSVLFVSVENRARSQIAEGLARHFLGHTHDVFSAGTKPAEKLHPMAVAVMAEIGIDISSQKPKNISSLNLEKIETVIILGALGAAPDVQTKSKKVVWDISDAAHAELSHPEDIARKFRKIRDDIRKRVLDLRAADQTW